MKPETRKILDDPELIEVREAHFMRLKALYAGEQLENEFILQGIGRGTEDDGPDWEKWLDESEENCVLLQTDRDEVKITITKFD